MLDTFRERAAFGEAFATQVHGLLRSSDFLKFVTRSGVEMGELAAFARQMRLMKNDPMAARLRFTPDGAMGFPQNMSHWEAKASNSIEKEPYEWYMRHEERGEPVFLIIAPRLRAHGWSRVFIGRVRDLVLIGASESISRFKQEHQYPTVDDWLAPRESPRGSLSGSGTPHRYIDFRQSKMLEIASVESFSTGIVISRDLLLDDTLRRLNQR